MAVVVLVEEKNKRRDLKDFELIKARSEGFKEHLIQIWGFRIRYVAPSLERMGGMSALTTVDVPTLLGTGPFSLVGSDRNEENKQVNPVPAYLRWPLKRMKDFSNFSFYSMNHIYTVQDII